VAVVCPSVPERVSGDAPLGRFPPAPEASSADKALEDGTDGQGRMKSFRIEQMVHICTAELRIGEWSRESTFWRGVSRRECVLVCESVLNGTRLGAP